MIKSRSTEILIDIKKQKYGKIYKGTNYPPYEKQSLGSIPSKYDSFLFQKQNTPQKYKNDKKIIFQNGKNYTYELYGNTVKFSFYPRNSKNNEENISETNILSRNNIKYFGGEGRFNNIIYRDLLNNKYYPGPGQYEIIEEKIPNYRYKSLFNSNKNYSLINKDLNFIGPGSYDCNIPKSEKYIIFGKEKKFPNYNTLFPINKDDIFIGPGLFDIPSGFNIHNKNKLSPVFVKKTKKKLDLEKKYIINDIKEEYKKEENETNNIIIQKKEDNWIKNELNKRIKERNKKLKNLKSNKTYDELNNFRYKIYEYSNQKENVNKGFALNNEPKFKNYNINHVPGPCYYNYENIIKSIKNKKSFHSKIKDFWI